MLQNFHVIQRHKEVLMNASRMEGIDESDLDHKGSSDGLGS